MIHLAFACQTKTNFAFRFVQEYNIGMFHFNSAIKLAAAWTKYKNIAFSFSCILFKLTEMSFLLKDPDGKWTVILNTTVEKVNDMIV